MSKQYDNWLAQGLKIASKNNVKNREEYALLEKQGIANLDTEVLKGLIEKFMA